MSALYPVYRPLVPGPNGIRTCLAQTVPDVEKYSRLPPMERDTHLLTHPRNQPGSPNCRWRHAREHCPSPPPPQAAVETQASSTSHRAAKLKTRAG